MYKYKQTTDVEVGDLVVWTDISKYHDTLTKDKVYQVTNHPDQNTLNVINDKGNKNSYGKGYGFKVLQTKPEKQAVVGDYMYRLTSGTPKFPQYSVIKITRTGNNRLGYSEELGVDFDEVIVIAQAEPEVKYPLFMQWRKELIKFDGLTSGIQLTTSEFFTPGEYKTTWTAHTDPRWNPCDFKTEPEIFDIDWWQARFEAGLPVYYIDNNGCCVISHLPPKEWVPNTTFSMTNTSLQKVAMSKEDIELFKQNNSLTGATTECSLQSTIKEQPMKLQQLLDTIFGVSDYEAKPKFIVTVFNNDKEVGTTTAESIEEIQQTIQSDTRLWGCKLVAHKIHSELQTQVPVTITKFKKAPNASAE